MYIHDISEQGITKEKQSTLKMLQKEHEIVQTNIRMNKTTTKKTDEMEKSVIKLILNTSR